MPSKKPKPATNKGFEEHTTYKGEVIRIDPVPQLVLEGLKSVGVKPKRPTVSMQTKTGEQTRPAKQGDPEYDVWQEELEAWEQVQDDRTSAVTRVLALKSYKVKPGITLLKAQAEDLEFPEEVQILLDTGLLDAPDDIWALKALWVESVVISRQDDIEIFWKLQSLSGVPEEAINQMKESFRDSVFGSVADRLGTGADQGADQ